ncbi:unnamed protein product, partial [Onchocerca ochengi]
RGRQRMAQMQAERLAARLKEARLRARQPSSTTSGLLPFKQNECDKLREAEGRLQETDDQRRTGLHVAVT